MRSTKLLQLLQLLQWLLLTLALLIVPMGTALASYKAGMTQLQQREFDKAVVEFENDPSSPDANFWLSLMISNGLDGSPQGSESDARAFEYMMRAAELNHPQGRFYYVYMLATGIGVPADPVGAIEILEDMVASGDVEAHVVLGKALLFGWWGVNRDEPRAVSLFGVAMDQGNLEGRAFYALCLQTGTGIAANEFDAADLFLFNAEQGHLPSLLEYARALLYGLGVERDTAQAISLYRTAAEMGDRVGQYKYALSLMVGFGVPQDEAAAAFLMQLSARQGYTPAMVELGSMYYQGMGVPPLARDSYYWYYQASLARDALIHDVPVRVKVPMDNLSQELGDADWEEITFRQRRFLAESGLKPDLKLMLSRPASGSSLQLGDTRISVPAPDRFVNGADQAEVLLARTDYTSIWQKNMLALFINAADVAKANDPETANGMRTVMLSRFTYQDAANFTLETFANLKDNASGRLLKQSTDFGYQNPEVVIDSSTALIITHINKNNGDWYEAIGYVLVKNKVLSLLVTGFDPREINELVAVVDGYVKKLTQSNE